MLEPTKISSVIAEKWLIEKKNSSPDYKIFSFSINIWAAKQITKLKVKIW